MFSLIITIISIALVAALALATLYYGGDAFNQGRAGAFASQLINEAQQVQAAVQLAEINGADRATVQDLVDGEYLTQAPAEYPLATTLGTTLEKTGAEITVDVCEETQARATGSRDISEDTVAVASAAQLYGCVSDGAATPAYTFFFKL